MIPHKLKVTGMDLNHTKVNIDGNDMKCRSVVVDMGLDHIHSATIELDCVPEIDADSWITYGFTPETVEQAIGVIKSKLKNGDYDEKRQLIVELEKLVDEMSYLY